MKLLLVPLIASCLAVSPAAAQRLTMGVHVAGRVEGGCRLVAKVAQPIRPSCSVPLTEIKAAGAGGRLTVVTVKPAV